MVFLYLYAERVSRFRAESSGRQDTSKTRFSHRKERKGEKRRFLTRTRFSGGPRDSVEFKVEIVRPWERQRRNPIFCCYTKTTAGSEITGKRDEGVIELYMLPRKVWSRVYIYTRPVRFFGGTERRKKGIEVIKVIMYFSIKRKRGREQKPNKRKIICFHILIGFFLCRYCSPSIYIYMYLLLICLS